MQTGQGLVVILLVAGSLLLIAEPAGACSCVVGPGGVPAPVVFEGTAVERMGGTGSGALWAFDVEEVVSGQVDARQVVALDVNEGDPNGVTFGVSSCSVGAAPLPGGRYHVQATDGSDESGDRRLYVRSCGGDLDQLSAAPATTVIDGPFDSPDATRQVLFAAGALVLLIGAGGVGIWRLARRSAPSHP